VDTQKRSLDCDRCASGGERGDCPIDAPNSNGTALLTAILSQAWSSLGEPKTMGYETKWARIVWVTTLVKIEVANRRGAWICARKCDRVRDRGKSSRSVVLVR
jgi:hypothetical protein